MASIKMQGSGSSKYLGIDGRGGMRERKGAENAARKWAGPECIGLECQAKDL